MTTTRAAGRRLLVIGATGYVGRVVTEHLQVAGHEVRGTARTSAAAQALTGRGVDPVPGDLTHPAGLVAQAGDVDGVILTASSGAYPVDHRAVAALLDACAGTGKLLLLTSGSAVVADLGTRTPAGELDPHVWTEADRPTPPPAMADRVVLEDLVLAATSRDVRAVVVRPPLVHGRGGSLQVPLAIEIATTLGSPRFVGEGRNRWSTVHVDDLADLYQHLVQDDTATGLFHASADEVAMGDLAAAVAQLLHQPPPRSWTLTQATDYSDMAAGLGSNSRTDSTKARTRLGWHPHHPDVLTDITHGSYSPQPTGATT